MQGEKKECEAGGQTYAKGIHQQECQSAVVRRKRDVQKSICRNKQDGFGGIEPAVEEKLGSKRTKSEKKMIRKSGGKRRCQKVSQ